MQDDADETIARIAAALRPLPDVDALQKARVLVAVAAERERDRRADGRRQRAARWLGATGALIAAGALATFFVRDAGHGSNDVAVSSGRAQDAPSRVQPTSPTAAIDARLATRATDVVVLQPVQLVLRAPDAHRVSIVGDFNGWDANAATMTRDAASGLWSQTLSLRPGRHVYAFIVDDSIWIRDPRTPAANDADFGRPGSVLLVGRP